MQRPNFQTQKFFLNVRKTSIFHRDKIENSFKTTKLKGFEHTNNNIWQQNHIIILVICSN